MGKYAAKPDHAATVERMERDAQRADEAYDRRDMEPMRDSQVDQITHSQNIARKIGSAQMAVEVYGWAIKYALHLPAPAFNELLAIVSKEPK